MSANYGPRPATLDYYQDRAGKFRWCLKSSNGNKIASSSQGYATMIDCRKNAVLIGDLLGQLTMAISAPTGNRGITLYRRIS